ncbi:DNA-binding protein WhiA [Aminivibrio sp.]|uniref:DNA-binding protein WhiA n=1 Tax=Aminivibrio sp. TaxID=1872489 RepID=UPI001A4A52F4|nr:DNA-binding protein WhiA [Aminivibrio sp.]MBL3538919.1 DNA-binding protein WhiA [Aminivibrio sp.]
MANLNIGKTLSSFMWDEWLTAPPKNRAEAVREIRGILQGMAASGGSESELRLSSGRLWIFRRLIRLWGEGELGFIHDFPSLLNIPRSLKGKVFLRLPERLTFLRHDRTEEMAGFDRKRPDWLRGLWGSCGALYIPRSGYYLSFRIPSRETEHTAAAMLKKCGFSFGRRYIQGKHEITLRNQEEIVTLLAGFGLVKTSLRMEEKAIVRSMRNRANMLVNCDSSNIRKSLDAATKQLEIARAAVSAPGFESLPEVLKNLVKSRVANPSVTLEELGKMQSPPISKSTVLYRWKKLEQVMGPASVSGKRNTK